MPVFFFLGKHDRVIPPGNQQRVFRYADRNAEVAGVVRRIGTRTALRGANEVHRSDGGIGTASSRCQLLKYNSLPPDRKPAFDWNGTGSEIGKILGCPSERNIH